MMLEYPTDSIFFSSLAGYFMNTNCAQLFMTVFVLLRAGLHSGSHETDLKHLAKQYSFISRYSDDVLLSNNSKFSEYLEVIWYPNALEITVASVSYFNCYFFLKNGTLTTLYAS